MTVSRRFIALVGRRKRLALNTLRGLVTVVGITLVATQINLAELWRGLLLANWRMVALTLLIFQLGIVIRAIRWQALLSALQTSTSLPRLIGLYYAGAFFNVFLPTGFGGDVVRAVEIGQDTDANTAIATVGIDRLSGLYVLFVIALLALPLEISVLPTSLIVLSAVVCVVGIAGWMLLFHTDILVTAMSWVAPRVGIIDLSGLVRLAETIRQIDRRAVRRAVWASLAFDVLLIATNYMMSEAFGLGLPILPFAVFTPLSSLLLLLPSIQGLGVREPVYVLLLGSVGIEAERAVAFSLGVYMLSLSTGLVGAVYYAIYSLVSMLRPQPSTCLAPDKEDKRGR